MMFIIDHDGDEVGGDDGDGDDDGDEEQWMMRSNGGSSGNRGAAHTPPHSFQRRSSFPLIRLKLLLQFKFLNLNEFPHQT